MLSLLVTVQCQYPGSSLQPASVTSVAASASHGGGPQKSNVRTLSDFEWYNAQSSSAAGSGSSMNYQQRTFRDFATHSSRVGFVRKVYSIFSVQMLTTILVTANIMTNDRLKYFLYDNHQVVTAAAVITSLVSVMSLVMHPRLRYKQPQNLVVLGLHTVCQSILLGVFCTFFNPRTVCLGTMHTLTAFVAITAWSFAKPNYNLNWVQTLLFLSSTSLGVGALLGRFMDMPLYDNMFSAVSAVLMASYVAQDTQAVVRGEGKYAYGQKEYILAALNLYQDLYRMFMHGMHLLAKLEQQKHRRQQQQQRRW